MSEEIKDGDEATVVSPETHKFCCLGVKAHIEGAFDGFNVDAAHPYYFEPGQEEEEPAGQVFLTKLNDDVGLSFEQIAYFMEELRGQAHHVLSLVDWLGDMPEDEYLSWTDALRDGGYEQGRTQLAQEKAKGEVTA